MIHGGMFCTATVGGLMPASAREDSRRSSDIVRIDRANWVCSCVTYAAPWSGSVGESIFEICKFSKVTVRNTLSTCVRVLAKITPKLAAFVPLGLIASAARKSRWLSVQELTCG